VDEDEEPALRYLKTRASHEPRPMLVAVLPERAPQRIRRAFGAGADDVLFEPIDPAEASRVLLEAGETRRRRLRAGRGVVCAFASTIAGAGVTTVSASFALALRYRLHRSVAVVDLSLQNDGLATFLDIRPQFTIRNLLGARQIDSFSVVSALTRHPSGVYALAGPGYVEPRDQISGTALAAMIGVMRELFDFVVLDCGSHVDRIARAAWEQSDVLCYVLNQWPGSARAAWRWVRMLDRRRLAIPEPLFVLNQFSAQYPASEPAIRAAMAAWRFVELFEAIARVLRTHGHDAQVAEPEPLGARLLSQPFYARITRDDRTLERSLVRGRDLFRVAPRSPLARAIEHLARRVSSGDDDTAEPAPQGVVTRLLARLGA
jgi:pilus assembly protein CpaE